MNLTAARTVAGRTLVDSCAVTRAGIGPAVLNRDTGQLTRPADTAVWSGPCSLSALAASNRSTVGEDDRLLNAYVARVPVSASGVRTGDLLTVTAIHAEGDPDLVGRVFTVREPTARTTTVLRRLILVSASEADGVPT